MITFIYEGKQFTFDSEKDVEINVDMCLSEIKAKEEALRLYGYHLMTCKAYEIEEGLCTCGFEQALKGERE